MFLLFGPPSVFLMPASSFIRCKLLDRWNCQNRRNCQISPKLEICCSPLRVPPCPLWFRCFPFLVFSASPRLRGKFLVRSDFPPLPPFLRVSKVFCFPDLS